ncbi:hypothetical protein XO10_04470 [Marinitoga sp. 1135]|uniref:Transcriptional regulator n=1 Tax=Marinitoga piezophila (strain DSM 14283 / JCM 11233 / KA3) TaxID=443254 RepID=H2J7C6_MARPK|nr:MULTISPECIES: MarR family transcriptional regulator [Marinitoga]AEX85318.1 transcriptional regulator [Marinitoga piezophila KA3]APT75803.1 hypothetical protein LN42_04955 [Marinitoga sp. 1137]NUU95540.1 hypothetical protein [Marinitoga sp. 1135]NUU97468.1 hypothetical protein [Marinitoga sp. 1138]
MDERSSAIEVIKLIKEIKELLRKAMTTQFENMEITSSQWMILGILMKNGRMKIGDLSKEVGLSNSTVTGIIDRLEKRNFVKRVRDSKDRRVIYIELTEEFEKNKKGLNLSMDNKLNEFLENVSETELKKVIDGLGILKDVLTKNLKGDDENN